MKYHLFNNIHIWLCSFGGVFCILFVGVGLLFVWFYHCMLLLYFLHCFLIHLHLSVVKKASYYRLWNQAIPLSLCSLWCPFKGGGWWLLFSLAGQLSLILLLCCTFLKRPLDIYNTIKSIFLWCNFPFPAYFVSDSAECVINFLL